MKIVYMVFSLKRPTKRAIQVATDCVLIALCFWLAMALRLDGLFTEIKLTSWFNLAAVAPFTIVVFARLGLYRAVVRYMAERAVTVIVVGSALSSLTMFLVTQYFSLEVPRSVPAIYFSLLVVTTGGTRLFMRTLYLTSKDKSRAPVAIYGAGEAGRLLMRSLQESRNYSPALFIDDDPRLQGTTISGTPVLSFDQAKERIALDGIGIALIASGASSPELKRQAAKRMVELGVEVRFIPKISDLVSGRVKISALRRATIEELLGREPVSPDPQLMRMATKSKSVLITGAGGSIGSELCRQILSQEPSRIVLLEISEYALYTIIEELSDLAKAMQSKTELIPIIGSVTERSVLEHVIASNKIESVYHAAAYKHVPLVEENSIEAIKNNSFGTHLIAQVAGSQCVKNFTLISTDKAVRPTNIMGATKRLSELVIQAAARTYPNTKFCAVRFGNVLGSSGSVVPKFERQIQKGGPITLTHPDITRYFMTIPEAAQLVIQAGAMAEIGETYILNMGEPIKIIELARTMCALNGQKLHESNTEMGLQTGIKLEITGLRAGEKLHEELLLTERAYPTKHPLIMKEPVTEENFVDFDKLFSSLAQLNTNSKAAELLASLPLGYVLDEMRGSSASEG